MSGRQNIWCKKIGSCVWVFDGEGVCFVVVRARLLYLYIKLCPWRHLAEGHEVVFAYSTYLLCHSPVIEADGLLIMLYLRRKLCAWRIAAEGSVSFSGHAIFLLLVQA